MIIKDHPSWVGIVSEGNTVSFDKKNGYIIDINVFKYFKSMEAYYEGGLPCYVDEKQTKKFHSYLMGVTKDLDVSFETKESIVSKVQKALRIEDIGLATLIGEQWLKEAGGGMFDESIKDFVERYSLEGVDFE